jgi:hypothetical protein
MYMDEEGAPHPVPTAEVYIPWTDSWRPLPALPAWTDSDGSNNMTDTRLMFLNGQEGLLMLHLLGGASMDWSIGIESLTPQVWRLDWNDGSHFYSWTAHYDQAMGGCSLRLCLCSYSSEYCSVFSFSDSNFDSADTAAAGVPDTFISSFRD